MTRGALVLALALLAALPTPGAPGPRAAERPAPSGVEGPAVSGGAGQQPTFRAGVEIVNFGVVVTDRRGNFITDLNPDDFEIVEEGEPQQLRLFARGDKTVGTLRGDAEGDRQELHVGLLFDTSGSMGEDLKLSRSAAIKFLNMLPDADDMTLVDFDTEVRVAKYGQADFPRLVERIRNRKPDGWTALYDALGVYLDGAHYDKGRKILVLYTDGGDTRSQVSFGEVMEFVRAADVTVFAIGLLEHQPSSVKAEQRMRLAQITQATGGEAFFPYSMKDVESAYEKILAQIRAQYSLGYVSTNAKTDGQWREVEIKVTRADLRVRTRKGYFAPYKESR
jgi:Ca-activated chloride channel family protein